MIDAILAAHGMRGPWTRLPDLGIANEIYATQDVVLRLATDHPHAEPDARTESVAAPAAYAVGIRTPRLLAFDDSRSLVERPYSLWERMHGETPGVLGPCPEARFAWDHLQHGLERMVEYGMPAPDVRALSGLLGR